MLVKHLKHACKALSDRSCESKSRCDPLSDWQDASIEDAVRVAKAKLCTNMQLDATNRDARWMWAHPSTCLNEADRIAMQVLCAALACPPEQLPCVCHTQQIC